MTFALTPVEPQGDGALEHWPTPAWVTETLLDADPPPTSWVVEPSAGDGAIAEVLTRHGHQVYAIEMREECGASLLRMPNQVVSFDDWLQHELSIGPWPFSIVMNPPYRPPDIGIAHVAHALRTEATYVAALLPLSWYSGTETRRRFWAEHGEPTALYGFLERPKFTGNGGQFEAAWFVWRRGRVHGGHGGQPSLKLLGRRAG